MALPVWSHQFCLACDKQVETDGAAYCSANCRLTELECSSMSSSQANSPGLTPSSEPWTSPSVRADQSRLFLSPAYDFSNAHPYGTTPAQQSFFGRYSMDAAANKPSTADLARSLSPSSSHASLNSIQSTASSTEGSQLSEKTRKELQAYSIAFDQVRTQRRRSY